MGFVGYYEANFFIFQTIFMISVESPSTL